jgi:DNA-binding NarL/FixJ family response regulator
MTAKKVDLEKIKVLIVEGTRMAGCLLADALGQQGLLAVVGATSDAQEALRGVEEHHPQVVLVSDMLEDQSGRGFELAKEIRTMHGDVRIVMLLDSSRPEPVVESFRAGAKGVFSRNESLQVLAKCIGCVACGEIWANSEQLGYAVDALSATSARKHFSPDELQILSKREHEVVDALIEGLSNREIAERLNLSRHTVKNHIFRVFEKLGVSSRFELMAALGRRKAANSAIPGNGKPDVEEMQGSLVAAAEAGFTAAQFVLGQMYLSGDGVPKDKLLAYKWLLLAERANCGFSEASRMARKRLATEMLASQIAEAERQAAEGASGNGVYRAPATREVPHAKMAARFA